MPPIVTIRNLSKHYLRGGQPIPVLNGIDLEIEEGDFLALMGPSGSGKSTLLNLIAGLDCPSGGLLEVAGTDIAALHESQLADWRARHIGFIFQFYNLIPVLTAWENVELPLMLTHLTRRERAAHVDLALSLMGLEERSRHYPGQLSGGQQQRVAIARALVTDPILIVADEPTGDLDRQSAGEILDLMERLNLDFGKTIVMVTHDQRAADKAHYVRHLDKGVLSEDVEIHAPGR